MTPLCRKCRLLVLRSGAAALFFFILLPALFPVSGRAATGTGTEETPREVIEGYAGMTDADIQNNCSTGTQESKAKCSAFYRAMRDSSVKFLAGLEPEKTSPLDPSTLCSGDRNSKECTDRLAEALRERARRDQALTEFMEAELRRVGKMIANERSPESPPSVILVKGVPGMEVHNAIPAEDGLARARKDAEKFVDSGKKLKEETENRTQQLTLNSGEIERDSGNLSSISEEAPAAWAPLLAQSMNIGARNLQGRESSVPSVENHSVPDKGIAEAIPKKTDLTQPPGNRSAKNDQGPSELGEVAKTVLKEAKENLFSSPSPDAYGGKAGTELSGAGSEFGASAPVSAGNGAGDAATLATEVEFVKGKSVEPGTTLDPSGLGGRSGTDPGSPAFRATAAGGVQSILDKVSSIFGEADDPKKDKNEDGKDSPARSAARKFLDKVAEAGKSILGFPAEQSGGRAPGSLPANSFTIDPSTGEVIYSMLPKGSGKEDDLFIRVKRAHFRSVRKGLLEFGVRQLRVDGEIVELDKL